VRVLPDLLAAAREHERTAALIPKRKRVSSGLKTVQRRRRRWLSIECWALTRLALSNLRTTGY